MQGGAKEGGGTRQGAAACCAPLLGADWVRRWQALPDAVRGAALCTNAKVLAGAAKQGAAQNWIKSAAQRCSGVLPRMC